MDWEVRRILVPSLRTAGIWHGEHCWGATRSRTLSIETCLNRFFARSSLPLIIVFGQDLGMPAWIGARA